MATPLGIAFNHIHFQEILDLLQDPAHELDLDAWPQEASPLTGQEAFLFTLAKALRIGPHSSPLAHRHPNKLISWSHFATLRGWVPPETTALLHYHLYLAANDLRKGSFWEASTPLWWEPIMVPDAFTRRWKTMHAWSRRLSKTVSNIQPPHPYLLHFPDLLPKQFVNRLFGQLERLYQNGALNLSRAGVGKEATIGDYRHDEVRYLNGCEPDLVDLCPDLCLLVRWAATQVTPMLAHASNQRSLTPPQRAMLARYPPNSGGYEAHVDNPGGSRDNGRGLTVILYLNPTHAQPQGGTLRMWASPEAQEHGKIHELPPLGGSLVGFDSREWLHQVAPLGPGHPRWALSLWLNDRTPPAQAFGHRRVNHTEMLFGIEKPPIPNTHCAMLHFDTKTSKGDWRAYPRRFGNPRVGIVCTTYRAQSLLPNWCRYHLQLGFSHLILVFDHLQDPRESALAEALVDEHGKAKLTIFDGDRLRNEGWQALPDFPGRPELFQRAKEDASSWSVASRQALNASYVLGLAKSNYFDGKTLDWLVHLDSDEFFQLQGPARGGESLNAHFAIATHQKWSKMRYLNAELLAPWDLKSPPVFKENPRLAAARLGDGGWDALCNHLRMNQTDERPFFIAYHNGKSAVRVAKGLAAAGVHDWYVVENSGAPVCVAGPTILHFHCPDGQSFAKKFQNKSHIANPPTSVPFELSPLEKAVGKLLHLQNASGSNEEIRSQLVQLFERFTRFTPDERALLNLAKLLHSVEGLMFSQPLAQEPATLKVDQDQNS